MQVPITMDVEDVGSLISFIDTIMPAVDIASPDSRESAERIVKIRNQLREALPEELAMEISELML